MHTTITNWIQQINNNETVKINLLSELFSLYPNITFDNCFPTTFLPLVNWTVERISVNYSEDAQTVEDVTFNLSSTAIWAFMNGKHNLKNIEVRLTIIKPDEVDENYAYASILGNMTCQNTSIAFPVSLKNNEIEIEDVDEEIGWIVSMRQGSLEEQAVPFNEFETFIGIETFEELIPAYPASSIEYIDPTVTFPFQLSEASKFQKVIPEYIGSSDSIVIAGLEMHFNFELDVVSNLNVRIDYGDVVLVEDMGLIVKNAEYIIETQIPCQEELVQKTLEGTLALGEQLFPRVSVTFPDELSNQFNIKMLDDSYTVGDFSSLDSLSGSNIASALPSSLVNFSGLNLTKFSTVVDVNKTGLIQLYLTVKPNVESGSEYTLIPEVLSMRELSLDFALSPMLYRLHGIVTLKNTAVPMMVTYEVAGDSTISSTLIFELDSNTQISSVPINYTDFSVLGFAPLTIIPGLDSLGLELNELALEFEIGESMTLSRFTFNIGTQEKWNIIRNVALEKFNLDFEYEKAELAENDTYVTNISGILHTGIADTDPIPVDLTINSGEDWSLLLAGESETGVALPGLNTITNMIDLSFVANYFPSFLTLADLRLVDLCLNFPNPAEQKLTSLYIETLMPQVLSLSAVFELKNLKLALDVSYTETEPVYDGSVACTFEIGSATIPLLMPLPFNESEWSLQLESPAQIPSFLGLGDLIGSTVCNWLSELITIPEMEITRFDVKFDVEPFNLQRIAFKADFENSISTSLPPGIEVNLSSIAFEMTDNSGSGLEADYYTVYGSIVRNDLTIPIKITRTATHWELSIDMAQGEAISINIGQISSIIPGLSLPSIVEDVGTDIVAMNLKLTLAMEIVNFTTDFDVTGLGNLIPGDIIKNSFLTRAIYEVVDEKVRYGIQILEWPFTKGDMKELAAPNEGWVLIDLWEFGKIKVELPKLLQDGENFIINGTIEATHDSEKDENSIKLLDGTTENGKSLNFPLQVILDKIGLSILDKVLPDKIPLVPEQDLGDLIDWAGGNPSNLPHNFQDYYDMTVVPDAFEYDLIITSSGDLNFMARLPEEADGSHKPLKLLGIVGATPVEAIVVGLKVYHFGFSAIKGFPFLNVDVEFDTFSLAILAALSYLSPGFVDKLDNFIDLKDVNFHLNAKDVWLLLSTVVPVPLFYDDISFKYCGLEGLTLETGIKLPKPGINVADFAAIGELVVGLKRYLTEANYLLNPDVDLQSADLKFSLGKTYAKMPKYLGSRVLGENDENVFTKSAIEALCLILNTLKKPSLTRFIKIIPESLRCPGFNIDFGPMNIAATAGITSPLEFVTDNPTGLSSTMLHSLFPDIVENTLVTSGDSASGLPAPSHFIECNDASGTVITDRVTGKQLVSANGKTLNWQRADIKGYKSKGYIQGGETTDLTSTVTGDIFDKSYGQYTISFLINISDTNNGCILSTSSNTGVWFYNNQLDMCGGAKAAAGSIPIDQWVRITCVQDSSKQYIYVERDLKGERTIHQSFGVDSMMLGALNEGLNHNVFNGAYTDIYIYNQALTSTQVSALCDQDDRGGLKIFDQQDTDERLLTLFAGSWNVGSLISSQVMLGVAIEDFQGAGVYMGFNGSIGENFLGLRIAGRCEVSLDELSNPFVAYLNGNFYLLGKEIIACTVLLDSSKFTFDGTLDLFDWKNLTVKGDVNGTLTKAGTLSLGCDTEIGIGPAKASAHVAVKADVTSGASIEISGSLYNVMDLSLAAKISKSSLYFKGSASTSFGFSWKSDTIKIPTPFGTVSIDAIQFDFGISASIKFVIGTDDISLKIKAGFTCLSKSVTLTISLPSMPANYSALVSDIKEAVKDYIRSALTDVPAMLNNFIEWAKIAWSKLSDYAKKVAALLKVGFNKTFSEIGDIMGNIDWGFGMSYDDIADGLCYVGATASQAGKVLKDLGCDTLEGVLRGAGYVADEVGNFIDSICPKGCPKFW